MSSAGISRDQLRSIVERIERLEAEKAETATDIKEVYAEAKDHGFDTKVIRQVIRLRKLDTAKRQEQEALLDVYLAALGMTPIERAIADSGGEGGAPSDDATPPARGKGRPRSPAAEFARDLSGGESEPSARKRRGGLKGRVAKGVATAVARLGTPVPLTDEEKARGVSAAFVGKDGTRMSIGLGVKV